MDLLEKVKMESADERIAQLAAEMADKQVKEEDEVSTLQ